MTRFSRLEVSSAEVMAVKRPRIRKPDFGALSPTKSEAGDGQGHLQWWGLQQAPAPTRSMCEDNPSTKSYRR